MQKPEYLYRGIHVSIEQFKNMQLYGVDMVPPNPPKINEKGQKVVDDGNEYGVYMTDNKTMALDVYGNVHGTGRLIEGAPRVNFNYGRITEPLVGVTYEINTNNIKTLRKPWIMAQLEGHYNNGYGGDEWIADKIPAGNYKPIRIVIGKDLLHDAEIIEIDQECNIDQLKTNIIQELEKRKQELFSFSETIKRIYQELGRFPAEYIFNMFAGFYKPQGEKWASLDQFDVTKGEDMCKYIICQLLQNNNFDIKLLSGFNRIKNSCKEQEISPNDIIEKEIEKIEMRLEQNNENENAKNITQNFKNSLEVYEKMLKMVENLASEKKTTNERGL